MPLFVNIEFQQFPNKINIILVDKIYINTIYSVLKSVDLIDFFDVKKWLKISLIP
jgi:hypothetical protein